MKIAVKVPGVDVSADTHLSFKEDLLKDLENLKKLAMERKEETDKLRGLLLYRDSSAMNTGTYSAHTLQLLGSDLIDLEDWLMDILIRGVERSYRDINRVQWKLITELVEMINNDNLQHQYQPASFNHLVYLCRKYFAISKKTVTTAKKVSEEAIFSFYQAIRAANLYYKILDHDSIVHDTKVKAIKNHPLKGISETEGGLKEAALQARKIGWAFKQFKQANPPLQTPMAIYIDNVIKYHDRLSRTLPLLQTASKKQICTG